MANENSVNRKLPGSKGQWILCSECPPTVEWADEDGDVYVWKDGSGDWEYLSFCDVAPSDYWLPGCWDSLLKDDPRPFALEPASIQPVTAERRIVQLMRDNDFVYAVADDGTAWVRYAADNYWVKLPVLPSRDA